MKKVILAKIPLLVLLFTLLVLCLRKFPEEYHVLVISVGSTLLIFLTAFSIFYFKSMEKHLGILYKKQLQPYALEDNPVYNDGTSAFELSPSTMLFLVGVINLFTATLGEKGIGNGVSFILFILLCIFAFLARTEKFISYQEKFCYLTQEEFNMYVNPDLVSEVKKKIGYADIALRSFTYIGYKDNRESEDDKARIVAGKIREVEDLIRIVLEKKQKKDEEDKIYTERVERIKSGTLAYLGKK